MEENKSQENEAMNTDMRRYSPKVKTSTVTAVQFFENSLTKIWPFFVNTPINVVRLIGGQPPKLLIGIDNEFQMADEGHWLVKDDMGRIDVLPDRDFRTWYIV